jgi:hypothetical protein
MINKFFLGPEWKERKRFFLRSLKDFGFGAKSEETVLEEAGQLSQHILNLTQDGQDYLVKGPLKGDPFLFYGGCREQSQEKTS